MMPSSISDSDDSVSDLDYHDCDHFLTDEKDEEDAEKKVPEHRIIKLKNRVKMQKKLEHF